MKALKYILIFIAVIVFVILGAVTYINVKGIPTYPYEEHSFTVDSDSAKVALGYELSLANCSHCHSPLDDESLEGRHCLDFGPAFGTVYSANITQHPTAGIGGWTDSEIATFVRTGLRKDGSFAPPYMPKFPLMADEDIEAIIAYLRSDHPSVQPSDHVSPPSEPSFLVKALCNFVIKPLPYPDAPIPKPAKSDKVAYGKYLATAQLGCFHCHSADFTTVDVLVPGNSPGYFGGGNTIYDHNGDIHLSSNITMDETGIAHYSAQDLLTLLTAGVKPDQSVANIGMPRYPMLDQEDADAILAFLKTVPKIENEVAVAE